MLNVLSSFFDASDLFQQARTKKTLPERKKERSLLRPPKPEKGKLLLALIISVQKKDKLMFIFVVTGISLILKKLPGLFTQVLLSPTLKHFKGNDKTRVLLSSLQLNYQFRCKLTFEQVSLFQKYITRSPIDTVFGRELLSVSRQPGAN